MRHLMSFFVFLVLIISPLSDAQALPPLDPGRIHASPPPAYAPDRVLVKFRPGLAESEVAALARQSGDRHLRSIPGLDVHVLEVPAGSVLGRVALYQRNPNVLYAEPDFYRILIEPNEGTDPPPPDGTGNDHFSDQWALNNTGQFHAISDPDEGIVEVRGSSGADIDAPQAWDITTGSAAVKIGILDTGVDCRDGANPLGSLEFSAGKCVEQVNFVAEEENLLDYIGHGSHVAGIAAAATNNGIGVAGVGWNSSVGSLKTCFSYKYYPYPELEPWCGCYVYIGVCPVSASATAIQYAADNDYHVINMSYASDEFDVNGEPVSYGNYSATEALAVSNAWASGVVLVAAAGNEGTDTQLYPAAYPEVIAVAATDHDDNVPDFSSFGSSWVSLMAPGENILSTVPNDFCIFYAEILGLVFDPNSDACLDWYSGTSMASPHVAGAAALVWAHLFSASLADPGSCTDADGITPCNQAVRNRLEAGADTAGALGQNMLAWSMHGRLNVQAALLAGAEPPVLPAEDPLPPPGGFTAEAGDDSGNGVALLSWSYGVDPGAFEVKRDSIHPKNGRVTDTVFKTLAGGVRDDTDDPPEGLYRYSLRALDGGQASDWAEMPDPVPVVDSSGGGESTGGGGKGGGKPKK